MSLKEPGDAPALEGVEAPGARGRRGVARRLYDWTIHWAKTPYAVWALFLLALTEASFFPIPPDVLLIAMALGAPRRSLRFAAVCLAGSVLGGCLGYGIGMFLFGAVGKPIINFYGAWDTYNSISLGFRTHGFFYIFAAALTPIPYKVFTIAAGACSVKFGVLVVASVVGRGLRFFAVGALFRFFGPTVKRFIDRYFNLLTILLLALGIAGFVCVKLIWKRPPDEPEGPGSVPSRQEQPIKEDAAAAP